MTSSPFSFHGHAVRGLLSTPNFLPMPKAVFPGGHAPGASYGGACHADGSPSRFAFLDLQPDIVFSELPLLSRGLLKVSDGLEDQLLVRPLKP